MQTQVHNESDEGTRNYTSEQWTVKVPAEQIEDYLALDPQHKRYGVQANLGEIRAFDVPSKVDTLVVRSDLQDPCAGSVMKRLGSGRSGFMDGMYLKGIGRTSLAANWSNPNDTCHATGHLCVSAAIRELVVTEYLRAKGAIDTIVPCNGFLVKRMDPVFSGRFSKFMHDENWPRNSNEVLQAITVKPGEFARLSNLIWMTNHIGPTNRNLWVLLDCLRMYACHPQSRPSKADFGITQAVDALIHATQRSLDRFRVWFELGVQWGSVPNNMTLDGRFLDLEVSMILAEPLVGGLRLKRRTKHGGLPSNPWTDLYVLGFEVLEHAYYCKRALERIATNMKHLSRNHGEAIAKEAFEYLAEELSKRTADPEAIWSKESLRARMLGMWTVNGINLRSSVFNETFESVFNEVFRAKTLDGTLASKFKCTGEMLAPPESPLTVELCAFLEQTNIAAQEERRILNETIFNLEQIRDPDQLLCSLVESKKKIRRVSKAVGASERQHPSECIS